MAEVIRVVELILRLVGIGALDEGDESAQPPAQVLLLRPWPHDLDGLDRPIDREMIKELLLSNLRREIAHIEVGRLGVGIVEALQLAPALIRRRHATLQRVAAIPLSLLLRNQHKRWGGWPEHDQGERAQGPTAIDYMG